MSYLACFRPVSFRDRAQDLTRTYLESFSRLKFVEKRWRWDSRLLRLPIAMPAFYEQTLWIAQKVLLTNPELHHGLLSTRMVVGDHITQRQTGLDGFERQRR